jgi:hypothetical protein
MPSSSRVLSFRPVNTPETLFQLDFDASPPVAIVNSVQRYAILRVRLFTVSSQQVDSIKPNDPRMYETLLGAEALSVHLNETVFCLNFDVSNPPHLFGIEEGVKRMMLCHSLFPQRLTIVTEPASSNGELCPICLQADEDTSNNNSTGNWVLTQCNHLFHARCLRVWIDSSSGGRCPMCRSGGGGIGAQV